MCEKCSRATVLPDKADLVVARLMAVEPEQVKLVGINFGVIYARVAAPDGDGWLGEGGWFSLCPKESGLLWDHMDAKDVEVLPRLAQAVPARFRRVVEMLGGDDNMLRTSAVPAEVRQDAVSEAFSKDANEEPSGETAAEPGTTEHDRIVNTQAAEIRTLRRQLDELTQEGVTYVDRTDRALVNLQAQLDKATADKAKLQGKLDRARNTLGRVKVRLLVGSVLARRGEALGVIYAYEQDNWLETPAGQIAKAFSGFASSIGTVRQDRSKKTKRGSK